jgi:hypothetical protein
MKHETSNQRSTVASGVRPSAPCPRCTFPGPHRSGPGAGPHYQRLLCGQCGAVLKWLPKPRPVVQEVRHA